MYGGSGICSHFTPITVFRDVVQRYSGGEDSKNLTVASDGGGPGIKRAEQKSSKTQKVLPGNSIIMMIEVDDAPFCGPN